MIADKELRLAVAGTAGQAVSAFMLCSLCGASGATVRFEQHEDGGTNV